MHWLGHDARRPRGWVGLTLCGEVLTLESEFRLDNAIPVEGFPEFTIAIFMVRGRGWAAGGVVRGAGAGSTREWFAGAGFARAGFARASSARAGSGSTKSA